MKHLLLFGLLVFCVVTSQGQGGRSLNLIVAPNSPTAASLSRYVDYPVTMSSGLPNISIPLYEFKSSRITVPIGLSYHAGGVRVTDRTSTLGLGWSLIAGGAIARAIVGLPDETPFRGFFQWDYPDSLSEKCDGFYYQHFDNDVDLRQIACFVNKTDNTNANRGGNFDSSPDHYYYNVQGLVGQFTYGANKKLYTIPYDPIEINSNMISFKSPFVITATDGVTYEFGAETVNASERSAIDYISVDNSPKYASAWYLTKIISADKSDTVIFRYSPDEDLYVNQNEASVMFAGVAPFSVVFADPRRPEVKKTCSSSTESNVRLLDIIGKNGRVHLNYEKATVNTDYNRYGADYRQVNTIRPLSSIEVYANMGLEEVKIKQFNFQQSFFKSVPDHAPNSLRLDGVAEVGFLSGSSQTNPPYTFSYATNDVPPYNTKSRDLWGFYNAYTSSKGDNDNMLLVNLPNPLVDKYKEPEDAFKKREANPCMLNMGMLESITYPTGGYTKFTFEPNSKLESVYVEIPQSRTHIIRTPMGEVDTTFIPDYKAYSRTLNIYGNVSQYYKFANEPRVVLKDETDNTIILDVWLVTLSGGNRESESKTVEVPNLNPNHTYRLFFPMLSNQVVGQGLHYDLFAYITEQLPPVNSVQKQEINAGGVRIKSIEHRNSLVSNTIVKKYNYTESYWNSDAFRGNYSTIKAAFGKQFYVATRQDGLSSKKINPFEMKNIKINPKQGLYIYQESPTYSIGSPSSSVSYSKVEELQVAADGTPLGKIEYTFNTGVDMVTTGIARALNWRQQVKVDRSFIRSQLLNKKFFKHQGDDWKLIQETQNFYNNVNDLPFDTKGTEFIRRYVAAYLFDDHSWTEWTGEPPRSIGTDEDCMCPGYVANIPLEFHTLFVNIVKPALDSTITRELGGDGRWIRNKTAYRYSNLFHMKPTEIVTTKSDGSTITQQILYSTDASGALLRTKEPELPGVNKLRLAYITTPIETISILQRKGETTRYLLGATINYYNPLLPVVDSIATIGLTAPCKMLKLDVKYNTRVDYKYNAKGLLVQQHKSGNHNETLLWGYNNTYPIAKLENMTYSQVLSNAILKSYLDQLQNYTLLEDANALSNLKVLNANIRSHIPSNATITTYTYAPLIGVTSQTSPNGMLTNFNYDPLGRLIGIRDDNGNFVSQYDYNYYNKAFKNLAASGILTKNDCPYGASGSKVTYTVLAEKYASTVSQTDADAKAQADVNQNGQAYANQHGICNPTGDGILVDPEMMYSLNSINEDESQEIGTIKITANCSWTVSVDGNFDVVDNNGNPICIWNGSTILHVVQYGGPAIDQQWAYAGLITFKSRNGGYPFYCIIQKPKLDH